MNFRIRNEIKKIVFCLMISLLGLMIANKALFTHFHKLSDGSIVSHAHPYHKSESDGPYAPHHHNQAEFIFFENLELFVPLCLFILVLCLSSKIILYHNYIQEDVKYPDSFHPFNKAPPVF